MRHGQQLLPLIFLLAAATLTMNPRLAKANEEIMIDVGKAATKKSLLALPTFQYFGSDSTNRKVMDAGRDLFETVRNDLEASGYFQMIKPEAFIEDVNTVGLRPAPGAPNGFSFNNWKPLGAEFLVRGGYRSTPDKITFEVYLYYVPQAKTVLAKSYEGEFRSVRRIGHTFSNDAIKALTGKQGFFMTQIVATAKTSFKAPKEIYLMSWDGTSQEKISNHRSIAVSPSWSPDGKKIAYTAFENHPNMKSRNSDLFIYEIATQKRMLVSYRKGLNSGSSFFPSGKELLLTISLNGNPDIYRMDLSGGSLFAITKGPAGAMNVEAVASPDNSKIAFSSDRSGKPMLYIMDKDGSGVKRLTFAGIYNSSPSWSPDGKRIAFSSFDKNHFDIFIINIDGSGLKRLTDAKKSNGKSADNRDPSFSPDGRQIAFTSNRTGNRQIYMVDPEGQFERRLTNDSYEWEQPRWSPFLE